MYPLRILITPDWQQLANILVIQAERPTISSPNKTLHGVPYEIRVNTQDRLTTDQTIPSQKVFLRISSSITVLAGGRIDGGRKVSAIVWNGGHAFSPHGTETRRVCAADKKA